MNRPRKKVPVTEEDKKKSYYKYYLEPMAEPPWENIQKVLAALLIRQRLYLFMKESLV